MDDLEATRRIKATSVVNGLKGMIMTHQFDKLYVMLDNYIRKHEVDQHAPPT